MFNYFGAAKCFFLEKLSVALFYILGAQCDTADFGGPYMWHCYFMEALYITLLFYMDTICHTDLLGSYMWHCYFMLDGHL